MEQLLPCVTAQLRASWHGRTAAARHLGRRHSVAVRTATAWPATGWQAPIPSRRSVACQFSSPALASSLRYPTHQAGQAASFCADAGPVGGSLTADSWLHGALRDDGPAATVRQAFERYGCYQDNEVAWRSVCTRLLEQDNLKDLKGDKGMGELKDLVRLLAVDADLTIASFWDKMTEQIDGLIKSASLGDLTELAEMYCKIGCWNEAVFGMTISMVRKEMAVHWAKTSDLAALLDIFSRAGRSSLKLSRWTGQLFNEAQERLMEDAGDFSIDETITIVQSMARFQVKEVSVLQHLGRERLHAGLTAQPLEMPAQKVAAVCSAYGELGWRHDTVFKSIASEILAENKRMQRARAMGEMETVNLIFSASDIALIVDAMLTLKMHTGNTSWCKWKDNYQELLDVLTRRLDAELPEMNARSLAAASFVLGRARRGTVELHKAMYDQMMKVLEAGAEDASSPPQHELARFLYGLVMMGPTRKKDYLDTQWLMHWMCHHPHLFLLSDLVFVNRHLVCLGCFEKDYLKEFVPWISERVEELTKSDIMEVTQTYNEAGLRDEDLGQHFFWSLGRQFQKLHVKGLGGNRAQYKRVG